MAVRDTLAVPTRAAVGTGETVNVGTGWGAFAVGQAFALLLTATLAYYEVFSFFVSYDDEGCLMLLVKHVLDGHRLYDEIQSIYGPLYYLYKELLHGPLGLPLTHDVVRLNASALRLLAAIVSSAFVFAITRRVWLSVVVQVLVTLQLWPVIREPGHPEELAAVFVAGVALLLALRSARPRVLPVAAGVVAAAVVMTKVNVGVFTAVAVWMALLTVARRSRAVVALQAASALAALALPSVLMHAFIEQAWAAGFARIVTTAILAVALFSFFDSAADGTLGDLIAAVVGMVVGALAIVLVVVLQGTTLKALFECLLVLSQRFVGTFVYQPVLYPSAPRMGTISVVLALACAVLGRPRLRDQPLFAAMIALGRLTFAVYVVRTTWQRDMIFALNDLLVFTWIVLLPVPGSTLRNEEHRGRAVIAWLSVLEPLQAYPVAGSQMNFGHFPLVVCGVLALGDALAGLRALMPFARDVRVRAVAAAAAMAVLAHQGYGQLEQIRARYARGTSLALPGAERLHVGYGDAAWLRLLVHALRTNCDTFFAYAGFNSLYFWTGESPPTIDVVSHEITGFPEAKREEMIQALLTHPRACVVLHRGLAPFYQPFVDRINRDFRLHSTYNGFMVLVRKDAGAPAPVAPHD
jgi:hypothetical protein